MNTITSKKSILICALILMGLLNTQTPKTNATTPTKTPKIQITTRVESFKCKENVFSGGFDSCNTELNLSLEDLNRTINYSKHYAVTVNCEATIQVEDDSSYPLPMKKYGRDWKYVYMYTNYEKSSISINTRVAGMVDKTIKAKLNNVECKISSIKPY
jgi:hypothetical protein